MMYTTLAALAVLGLALWFWRSSLRARETADAVCRRTCDSYGVQFLDDTVALASIRPVIRSGRLALRRVYLFEYSCRGNDREAGSLTLTDMRVETVYLADLPSRSVEATPGARPRC